MTFPDHASLASALRALERASRLAYQLSAPAAETRPAIAAIIDEVAIAEAYLAEFKRSLV